MAVLYSVSSEPMASSSSGVKESRSRSCRTERMAFWDCHRQSSHWWSGTSRQSGWRLGLPGGSSSSTPPTVRGTGRGSSPVRSSTSLIVREASIENRVACPLTGGRLRLSPSCTAGSVPSTLPRGCYRDVDKLQGPSAVIPQSASSFGPTLRQVGKPRRSSAARLAASAAPKSFATAAPFGETGRFTTAVVNWSKCRVDAP